MPRKNRDEYNDYMSNYMRGYRARKKSSGDWRTRTTGTPAQVGTKFRMRGMPSYQSPTPVRARFLTPDDESSKIVSHRKVSDSTLAYFQLMGIDPAFRSKSLYERLEVLQEAYHLSDTERAQLVSSIETMERDQVVAKANMEKEIARIEELAKKISLGSEEESLEGLNELRKENPIVFKELTEVARE
jgi:hypothetical protein